MDVLLFADCWLRMVVVSKRNTPRVREVASMISEIKV
jgi:hypothetical protein